MTGTQIRELQANGFEVGSHTLDHCYLTTVNDETAMFQIVQGKTELERVLGRSVSGFCYPGGKYYKRHVEMVAKAGFRYARSTANFYADIPSEPFTVPVSLQCYPHRPDVYMRNFVRSGAWSLRMRGLRVALAHRSLLSQLQNTLDMTCKQGGIFHLWGHSWELDKSDGWVVLENFLRYAAHCIPVENRLSNLDTLHRKLVLADQAVGDQSHLTV